MVYPRFRRCGRDARAPSAHYQKGANHALGEVLEGFRHVDAGIGDETAKPGRVRVGDSQERQSAGGGVKGMERFRPRVNLFLYASGKAQGSNPFI